MPQPILYEYNFGSYCSHSLLFNFLLLQCTYSNWDDFTFEMTFEYTEFKCYVERIDTF